MNAVFIGSHPAMDFLNTAFSPHGELVETIGDGPSFLQWLMSAQLLTEAEAARVKRRLGAANLDAAAAEARTMRDWAAGWIARWNRSPDADYSAELRRLNGLLHKGGYHREVVASDSGLQLVERSNADNADDLLALLAMQIASLITGEDPTLVRQCAGPGCTLWFVDRTKGHRRLFCSASACGNRAKVAAFRARQRQAE